MKGEDMSCVVCRKGVAAGLLIAIVTYPAIASAEDEWEFEIGAGVGYGSKYEGSDEMEVEFLPVLGVTWNDTVFLSTEDGLGVVAFDDYDFTVEVSLNYDWGRDESDSSDLDGLGDIDGAPTLNLGLEYELGPVSPFIELTRFLGGSDGLELSFGVETVVPVSILLGEGSASSEMDPDDEDESGPAILAGISTTWSDSKYMDSYFGIDSRQSVRSGLSRFNADPGFKSVNAELGFVYPVFESWEVRTMIEYSRLIGDSADSPISKNNDVLFGGLAVSYKF